MAYDEDPADRIRELIDDESGISERRMFGGMAFLVNGNMAIAASGQGGVLVRVDPADADRLIGSASASEAVMGGRSMRGWLRVAPEHLRTKRQLAPWGHGRKSIYPAQDPCFDEARPYFLKHKPQNSKAPDTPHVVRSQRTTLDKHACRES